MKVRSINLFLNVFKYNDLYVSVTSFENGDAVGAILPDDIDGVELGVGPVECVLVGKVDGEAGRVAHSVQYQWSPLGAV